MGIIWPTTGVGGGGDVRRTGRWGLLLVVAGVAVLAWVPAMGLSATAGPSTTTAPVTIGFKCTFNGITIDDWATIQVTKPAYVQPGDTFDVTFAVTDGPSSGALNPSPTVIYTGRTKLAVTGATTSVAWTPEVLIAPQSVVPSSPIVKIPPMITTVTAGASGEVKVSLSNIYVIWRQYPFVGATTPIGTFVCVCTPKQNLDVTIPIQGGGGTTTAPPTTGPPVTTTTSPNGTTTTAAPTTTAPNATTTTTTTTAKPVSTTTSTTAPPASTTTAAPTTTTTSPNGTTTTTTTTAPGATTTTTTTTTAPDPTTTTALPSVLGATEVPSSPAGLGSEVVPSDQPAALAFTGGGVGVPLSIGAGLLVLGSALIVWDRRRGT